MKIKAIGLDLAKNVFQVHGVDEQQRPVLCRQLRRAQMLTYFARLEPCLIGMEACGGAHYWARKLSELGHEVRLIAPQFVKPYVKSNKNDARDAEAICEALLRPSMRFVAIKSVEQQAVLALHRLRDGLVSTRTALINRLRGLLGEFGVVVPVGRRTFEGALPRLMQQSEAVPELLRAALAPAQAQLIALNTQIDELEGQLSAWHRTNATSQRLAEVPGVGVLSATAIVATVGDARAFDNGRQFAAWLGLTPRQHSSGSRTKLLGISKRGDAYVRKLLVHGARSVLSRCRAGEDSWLGRLLIRRPKNVATVALAQHNARVLWALMAREEHYRAAQASVACG